jgi:hypothetical protein
MGAFRWSSNAAKPYNYSLFNLDMLAMVCVIASASGIISKAARRTICGNSRYPMAAFYKKAVDFLFPLHRGQEQVALSARRGVFSTTCPIVSPAFCSRGWRIASRSLLRCGARCRPILKTPEIVRNFPIRQPVLWLRPV